MKSIAHSLIEIDPTLRFLHLLLQSSTLSGPGAFQTLICGLQLILQIGEPLRNVGTRCLKPSALLLPPEVDPVSRSAWQTPLEGQPQRGSIERRGRLLASLASELDRGTACH